MELAFECCDRFLDAVPQSHVVSKETAMQWTTPAYTNLRFGFEITMYIANR
ncbi:coenzyme PQQ precursor peptide PqqA [Paraburkholderia sp. WC7.3g]